MAGLKDISIAIGENGSIVLSGDVRVEIRCDRDSGSALKNSVTIAPTGDGHLAITTLGTVFITSANSSADRQLGERMPDGTVYAGISPDTKQPMYTTRRDELNDGTDGYSDALQYAICANQDPRAGRRDWRVPSINELKMLFNNRAVIGGFLHENQGYMSSSETSGSRVWVVNDRGEQEAIRKNQCGYATRLVRG